MIYFIFGQSGSGKTTLAKAFKEHLHEKNMGEETIVHIDGDVIRQMTDNYDYGKNGRRRNLNIINRMATALGIHYTVIVSVVCPFRWHYMIAKQYGAQLIYLYNWNSQKQDFHVDYFERPHEGDAIEIDTTGKSINESLVELLVKLKMSLL